MRLAGYKSALYKIVLFLETYRSKLSSSFRNQFVGQYLSVTFLGIPEPKARRNFSVPYLVYF